MIKKLITLIPKTNNADELTKYQFLYTMTFENQNKYCLNHNVSFKEVINNLK